MQNITLIGMPGSGKTTVGEALAKRLGWEFVDTDLIINPDRTQLQKIIDTQGSAVFRKLEEEAILSIQNITDTVISPGGSVIYSPRAMELLKSFSTVIFLDVPLPIIQSRCDAQSRAIVGLKEKGWDVLYAERNVLYKKYADIEVIPEGGPPDDDAVQILGVLGLKQKLPQEIV